MAKNIPEQEIRQVLSNVKHPVIDCTLIDLGILEDITIRNDKVELTLAFPFPKIPIKEQLINSVREPVEKLSVEVEVKITVMNQEKLQRFLSMEQDAWKGAL